jgi:hypothetical protein
MMSVLILTNCITMQESRLYVILQLIDMFILLTRLQPYTAAKAVKALGGLYSLEDSRAEVSQNNPVSQSLCDESSSQDL